MRLSKNTVVIQEPPLQELKKNRSCLKRTCITGGGCIFLFLVATLLLFQFALGPKQTELKEIPANIQSMMTLYDTDNIESIILISGKDKNKIIEFLAYVPKIVLSPIFVAIEKNQSADKQDSPAQEQWKTFIQTPVTNPHDTVTIVWSGIQAQPMFVSNYYIKELEKQNFVVTEVASLSPKTVSYSFEKESVTGSFYIEDNPDTRGTERFVMRVTLP
ncbi:MAG: hypothetical protein KBD15_01945 [Candidatus Magasanikbacteria bacterium]|nr:hypothetical protein [Candidatus Magasanikbacteria bacterium]